MNYSSSHWLLLVMSLPTSNATLRMRLWRAFKSLGCAPLRDGVYLLPLAEDPTRALEQNTRLSGLVDNTETGGGHAYLLQVQGLNDDQAHYFRSLFDRSNDYQTVLQKIEDARATLSQSTLPALRRTLKNLKRECIEIQAIDFFPGQASEQVQAALAQLESLARSRLSPDEPQAMPGQIHRLELNQFQHRLWATRHHPWIDRLASAWLILRFIDPQARFLWLETPHTCPPEAVSFDFDGATFTHVDAWVTFQVLLHSFGLETDPALQRLAHLVHYLDVGGIPLPEAEGLEMILCGARQQSPDDATLFREATQTFDFLYTALKEKIDE